MELPTASREASVMSWTSVGWDWDFVLRAFAITGMAVGAYRGYRQMRANGTWSTTVAVLQGALLLAYTSIGMAIILLYLLYLEGNHLIAFLVIAGVYFGGGLYVLWKLATRIQARFGPKAKNTNRPEDSAS